MTQFLIREFQDSTGCPFIDVEKSRDNETFAIVEAESMDEARIKYVEGKDD